MTLDPALVLKARAKARDAATAAAAVTAAARTSSPPTVTSASPPPPAQAVQLQATHRSPEVVSTGAPMSRVGSEGKVLSVRFQPVCCLLLGGSLLCLALCVLVKGLCM